MLRCMLLHRLILYAQVQGHQTHMYNFHVHRKEVVEHGIQRSEVPFFMETEDFFLCPMIVTRQKHLSLFVYRGQK